MPKVSVIVTAHNYGRYLPQAIESVRSQTFDDWELVVVNDGSTDNSAEILERYTRYPEIKVLTLDGVGLARAANAGIRASSGEYVIRLDADDYFDENILLILSNVLDRHPEHGMVFPDYYTVSKYGDVIELRRQQKVSDEVKLLDRSALAAGALYRRSCFDELDGYNEVLRYQEDYDFWIRFVDRFHVYNVQLPLMYYRRHGNSMSTNTMPRMHARRYVKKVYADDERSLADKKILCLLPMVAENRFHHKLPLLEFGGRPLFSYVLEQAKMMEHIDRIIVDTEDPEIAEAVRAGGGDVPFLRSRALAGPNTAPTEVFRTTLARLKEEGYRPDVVVVASYENPFIQARHMDEAAHSLLIHNCDSVISVNQNIGFHWQPGSHGLSPVLYPRTILKDQKWETFQEQGGLYAFDPRTLITDNFLGTSVSYIEVSKEESLRIDCPFSLWIGEQMLQTSYWDTILEKEREAAKRALHPPKPGETSESEVA